MRRVIQLFLITIALLATIEASEDAPRLIRGSMAHKILKSAYSFLDAQKGFSLRAFTISEDNFKNKMSIEVHTNLIVHLDRDGKIFVKSNGDSEAKTILLNNGEFLILDRDTNLYGKLSIPKENDKALDYLYERFNITTPLANLLYSDLEKRLLPKARGYYFGLRKLGNSWCHYIGFVNRSKELQVWVQAKGEPLIKRFVVIDRLSPLRLHSSTDLFWIKLGKPNSRVFDFKVPSSANEIPIKSSK